MKQTTPLQPTDTLSQYLANCSKLNRSGSDAGEPEDIAKAIITAINYYKKSVIDESRCLSFVRLAVDGPQSKDWKWICQFHGGGTIFIDCDHTGTCQLVSHAVLPGPGRVFYLGKINKDGTCPVLNLIDCECMIDDFYDMMFALYRRSMQEQVDRERIQNKTKRKRK